MTRINFTTRQNDWTNLYYIFTTSQIDWNKFTTSQIDWNKLYNKSNLME